MLIGPDRKLDKAAIGFLVQAKALLAVPDVSPFCGSPTIAETFERIRPRSHAARKVLKSSSRPDHFSTRICPPMDPWPCRSSLAVLDEI
jgi:hypothetical protein